MDSKLRIPLDVIHSFDVAGELISIEELKRGHINHTYVGVWSDASGGQRRYVHQLVNHQVFKDIPGLMSNVQIITERIKRAIAKGDAVPTDTTLSVVPTKSGATFCQDQRGEYWRTFTFVENTISFDICPGPEIAQESARILGRFQRYVDDIPVSSLCETIPRFHDGAYRYDALDEAVRTDQHNRAKDAREEIEYALSMRQVGSALIDALRSGELPYRPTHNDMKLNNVLFDQNTHRATCLVDLDTCMPGTPLFDYGDLVRNTVIPCAEDELDLSKVRVDLALYRAILNGYLEEFGERLTAGERKLMGLAPTVLAVVLGVRFLTDHLLGDTYFRIHRRDHNLHRARTQFQVARELGRVQEEI
jgi:Ser/Thr protein kinase RdoA (MazF antagonist)